MNKLSVIANVKRILILIALTLVVLSLASCEILNTFIAITAI